MSKQTEQALIIALHDLATSSHKEWKTMVAAFEDYTRERCIDAVQSPAENAEVARGHAQAILLLNTVFREIKERYETLQRARSKRP